MYLQGGSNELDIDSEACAVPSDIFKMGLIAKWSNSLVVKALASQSKGPEFNSTGWLQGRLSFLYFRGRSNEYQEFLGT